MGPAKTSRKVSDEIKWLTAVHESGHAVLGLKLKDAMEVQKITSRGIHGEIVSDEYITFVKTVCPKLLQQLKEISKKIEYIKCLNCGYSGYSKDGKICPKCGKDSSVDFW